MARSRISYNIHGQNVPDSPRLLAHLQRVQPTSVLVLDALGLAKEIKAMLPDTIVIHRNYGVTGGDDDVWGRVSPEKWLELRASESEGGIYLYTTNEPGWGADVLNWNTRLMELAAPRGVRLVVGNWAVGTPLPEQWPMARRLLELCNQYRDLFILGLHEYGCGVLTSGLVGGAPDDSRHTNYIPVNNWPSEAGSLTRFHCGRFKFLLDYCHSINLPPPRIILTEHGMDDVSDIKFWSEKLRVRQPYLNVRGWKTLQDQWSDWYGAMGWSPQRAYFEQLAWADRAVYRNSPVEAQLVYCWGHSSQMWEQFDVAEAHELHSLLETYAQQGVPEPVPTPPASFVAPSFAAPVANTQPAAPVEVPVPVVKPVGFAPIGVRDDKDLTAATAVSAAPAVAVPVGQPSPPPPSLAFATSQIAPEHTITVQVELSDADILLLVNSLRTMGQSANRPEPFERLADALEQTKSIG